MAFRPGRVAAIDWSAASTPGPRTPAPDRCWLAVGDADASPGERPPPEYFRTRVECEARLAAVVDEALAGGASLLLGFDFPIGYPVADGGEPVLPVGRDLCRGIAGLIEDGPDGANNRFEAASALNRRIRPATGRPEGPFWGHPPGRAYEDLSFRKTRETGCREFRAAEAGLRGAGRNIQSAWKLAGAGSVGSQALLGLPVVHRLLERAGDRGRLWPFEPIDRPDAVVVAEIWPSLFDSGAVDHPIKDARQVAATRDAVMTMPAPCAVPRLSEAVAAQEGWILGCREAGAGARSSRSSSSHTV